MAGEGPESKSSEIDTIILFEIKAAIYMTSVKEDVQEKAQILLEGLLYKSS